MPRVVGWRDGWEGGWKQARGWSESFFPETFQSPRLAFLRFLKSCSWRLRMKILGKGECVRVSWWRCEREGGVGPGEGWMGKHVRCAGVRGTTSTSKSPENLRFGSVSTIWVSRNISRIYITNPAWQQWSAIVTTIFFLGKSSSRPERKIVPTTRSTVSVKLWVRVLP